MEKNKSLHAYIKEELLNSIKANKYKKGEKIPTELELCETFNVSRTTVRTALNQLTLEGYLIRKQGKGTYVADEKVRQTLTHTVKKYSDQIAVQGKTAQIELVNISVVPANEYIINSLDVSLKDPIQRIERVRKANGAPTQYEIAYIPWEIAPGLTKKHAETSLYTSLTDEFGVQIAKTTEHIEIALADERICYYLNCEEGLPCFYMETIAENESGKKVEFSRAYYRGDKTNFLIERDYPSEH
ncbi:GntR family transcriptional regulator [Virgibacillus sp. MSJ-26]|uniref:GntR family transcriptional regulator n=1 Tax=Virgibacillus sp. MSJ-26 TaxID=2841522 RepID=UPI001C124B60|nr:GntR family transcriptional regulator [Virgibacillus sp. MSJ-26]MBU5467606.1 GntR family transcriptional regulator [Virgibacillus sp. MSJ-26]